MQRYPGQRINLVLNLLDALNERVLIPWPGLFPWRRAYNAGVSLFERLRHSSR